MKKNYLNIYNNLIKLTRNKTLYVNKSNSETFSDRLILFLLHFAFFLKSYKDQNNKKVFQELYDFVFRQIELSIREVGYGDATVVAVVLCSPAPAIDDPLVGRPYPSAKAFDLTPKGVRYGEWW